MIDQDPKQSKIPGCPGNFPLVYNMSIKGVPGAQDGDWGHVGVSGTGVVGHIGLGPS